MLVLVWSLAFAAAAAAVVALGLAIRRFLDRNPDLREQYRAGGGSESRILRLWRLAVQMVAREVPGSRVEALRRRIARDLSRSAAPPEMSAETFIGQALVEGLLVAAGCSALMLLVAGRPLILFSILLGLCHALLLRPHLLRVKADERVAQIDRRLPYAIDFAVLILGAGGTPREALKMIAAKRGEDPFAEEIAIAMAQVDAGTSQAKALTRMAERLELEDLTSLVIAINRGEEVGAPMAKALATQAEIFRFRRLQRAERLAVEAPVKMMFPNMIIMLAVLLIVLGPVIVKLAMDGLF